MNSTILCLALIGFHEDRTSVKTMQAVMEVAYNRTQSNKFPKDVCSVMKQKGQFSFYKGSMSPPRYEKESWNKSVQVATDFYKNKTNHTKGSLYFNHQRLGVRYKITNSIKSPIHIGKHVYF